VAGIMCQALPVIIRLLTVVEPQAGGVKERVASGAHNAVVYGQTDNARHVMCYIRQPLDRSHQGQSDTHQTDLFSNVGLYLNSLTH